MSAALKLVWLAFRNAAKKMEYSIKEWPRVLHQFAGLVKTIDGCQTAV